jgi:hypothetical protein
MTELRFARADLYRKAACNVVSKAALPGKKDRKGEKRLQ